MPADGADHRILVYAPIGRDAAATGELLRRAGMDAFVCDDLLCLVRELEVGAAAVFVEQLHEGSERTLRALGCFRAQAGTRFIANVSGSASPLRGLLSRRDAWCVNRADSDLDHEATYAPPRR